METTLINSYITHTFQCLDEDFVFLACIEILPEVFDTVNNLVYSNLEHNKLTLVFEVKVGEDGCVQILSVLNYACYAIEYYTQERVTQIEDEIYKVLIDFLRASENINANLTLLTLDINMSPLKVTVLL